MTQINNIYPYIGLQLMLLGMYIGLLIRYITYDKPHRFRKKDKIKPIY